MSNPNFTPPPQQPPQQPQPYQQQDPQQYPQDQSNFGQQNQQVVNVSINAAAVAAAQSNTSAPPNPMRKVLVLT
ncbi:MAG: hypothetical protein Q4A82_01265 [Corynebacterium sp.]|nr:hypothetical protein [Corynebacterium sp.]